ncbi:hypothetical protein EPUS_08672 [Endocarpon pusillum Z07020]|uniref:Seipin n=1 Tax=Endocarpon pusillum (strain Z07020 / HMAS-L-300199) TaxID=1263415 RepID=U1I1G9_ENDPU|nr:uncharacterized protein EPUS_08672 [Endocarpon pusillum Z07020]ERF77105.1 hypothetical protein EPUS_08672 [Endocarpon pusillum Z07020]
MAGSSLEDDEQQTLVKQVISTAATPIHIATSRPALKAYLSTLLFLAASLILLAISTTAYLLFYYNFIPQVDLIKVIHLQYADGPFPHSTTYLASPSSTSSALTSLQPYDITIHLHLPRTPTNIAAGNFMLDLSLLSPPSISEQPISASSVLGPSNATTLLARSRRPAILPYQSRITSLTNTFLSLPLHTLSLRDIDAATLSIPMFEKVTFARGWRNIPTSARLEIQTQAHTQATLLGQPADVQQHVPLQVYSASIEFHARFRGLRWLMYNWRIFSFLTFTSAFYSTALISTGVAWGLIALFSPSLMSGKEDADEQKKIKKEADVGSDSKVVNGHAKRPIKNEPADEDENEGDSSEESGLSLSNLSETATTFPTLSRHMPIRYPIQQSPAQSGFSSASGSTSGGNRIKTEEPRNDIEATRIEATTAGEFAEDEDEEGEGEGEGEFEDISRSRDRDLDRDRDSGIGTSMEESAREAVGRLQRRRNGTGTGTGMGSGAKR